MSAIPRTPTYLFLLFLCYQSTAFAFYNPAAGRWLSRDPLFEDGGINLQAMLLNDSQNSIDLLGLCAPDCTVQSFKITSQKWIDSWPSIFGKYSKRLRTEFQLVLAQGSDKKYCRIRQLKRGRVETAGGVSDRFPSWKDDGGEWWTGTGWTLPGAKWNGNTATFRDEPGLVGLSRSDFPIYWGSTIGPGFFDFETFVQDATQNMKKVASVSWGLYFEYQNPNTGGAFYY